MLTGTQENEEIIARVAALDIGKAELMCCVRVPDEDRPGRRLQEVQAYSTMTRSLLGLSDRLHCLGVTRVVMEATSVIRGSNKFLLCFGSSDRRVRVRDGRRGGHLIARGPGRVLPRAAAAGGGFLRAPVRGPGAGRWFPRGGGV